MRQIQLLLFGHIGLLLLASTNVCPFFGFAGDGEWRWNYFQIRFQSGWGAPYTFAYSLPQVSCYLAAYGLGVVAYVATWRRFALGVAGLAALLCALGLISFGIELTHWLWPHQVSWIASAPVLMVVLWALAGLQVLQRAHRDAPRPVAS